MISKSLGSSILESSSIRFATCLKQLFQTPSEFYFRVLEKLDPRQLWLRYSTLCCEQQISETTLILSFDCDTDEDIQVAGDVHSRLIDIGVVPCYAVPGALLERGEKVYDKILQAGAEFLNHGGREHTYFDQEKQRHASCFFYDQQPLEVLSEDILVGHEMLKKVLGVTARGWRTPHFGTFQSPDQLSFLYSELSSLDYAYSTSTVPYKACKNGPIQKTQSIYELPVTGGFSKPLNILDSWGFFAAPDRRYGPLDYYNECKLIAEFSETNPILINVYADPSHIWNDNLFFQSIQTLSLRAKNMNYSQLLASLR